VVVVVITVPQPYQLETDVEYRSMDILQAHLALLLVYLVADSLLEIKALNSKYPAQVTLNATISFTSSPVLQSGTVFSRPSINNISEEVRFSIGILPELGLFDYVNNVLFFLFFHFLLHF
jgi:hypothetical protein